MEQTNILEAKAEIALASEKRHIRTLEEYEKLGKSSLSMKSNIIFAIPSIILLASLFILELDSKSLSIVLYMVIATIFIQSVFVAEQKKTNRRIELLHKLITHEFEQKNT